MSSSNVIGSDINHQSKHYVSISTQFNCFQVIHKLKSMQNFFVWFVMMMAFAVFGAVAYMAWPPVRRHNILMQEMTNCIMMDRLQQLYLEEKYRHRFKIGDKLK